MKANGLRKSVKGILMLSAMVLLASLVHMLIHFSDTMEESALLIVGQAVIAITAMLGVGFNHYFSKQGDVEDE